MELQSGTVSLAFSTYPHDSNKFLSQVDENIKEYRIGRKKIYEKLNEDSDNYLLEEDYNFNPVIYHLFGNFDSLHIMFSDNMSVTNKLFTPTRLDNEEPAGIVKTQVISGMVWEDSEEDFINKKREIVKINNENKYDYTCVIKCKINNNYLLGNGYSLIKNIYEYLRGNILNEKEEVDNIFLDTFSSSEVTLLLFSDSLITLYNRLEKIRSLSLNDIGVNDTVINNSQAHFIFEKYDDKNNKIEYHKNSHIWANTQSFFGIRLIKKEEGNKTNYSWVVSDNFKDNIKSLIEWEVIPGHENSVYKILNKLLDFGVPRFIPGKRDYIYELELEGLEKNYKIFQELRKVNSSGIPKYVFEDLKDYVRKVKTKLLFDVTNIKKNDDTKQPIVLQASKLIASKTAIPLKRINQIRENLKSLNVSSELRTRLVKLFNNFSIGIQNPLIANLFYDLLFFVKMLEEDIENESNKIFNLYSSTDFYSSINSVNYFDEKIIRYIEYYEQAQLIRLGNNYFFDEISDIILPHNNYQQLITSIDNYFKTTYQLYSSNQIEGNRIITRTNQLHIKTTSSTVNFSVYSLYESGMLFYITTKEILNTIIANSDVYGDEILKRKNIAYNDIIEKFFLYNRRADSYLIKDTVTSLSYEYLISDYLRFYDSFYGDYKLFFFWHFAYVYQSSHMYKLSGELNKELFFIEMLRMLILAYRIKNDSGDKGFLDLIENGCLHNSWKIYWDEAFYRMKGIAKHIAENTTLWDMNTCVEELEKKLEEEEKLYGAKTNKSIKIEEEINKYKNTYIYRLFHNVDRNKKFDDDKYNYLSEYLEGKNEIENIFSVDSDKAGILKAFSYLYMRTIYKASNDNSEDGVKIPIVLRSWKDGKINVSHNTNEAYFTFDQNGGIFFHNQYKLLEYSKIRNRVFALLIQHNYLYKKELITKFLETK